ncbi:CHC2 zinc finger domain-containing protein [Streptomyces olivoreticuli]|uniref:CHC2 zinc finger domain-containing protein n=1 Tax=Streptomyces olivoreticuli TaxID=68246 RepID=UPI003F5CC279
MHAKPSIADVFRHYYPHIRLRAAEGWQKILCPLHPENNPSAAVNVTKNKWHCFACALTEDSWDVIQREEGLSFRESADLAAERFGRSGEAVRGRVPGKPRRGVHRPPRFGSGSGPIQARLRRFGSHRP